MNRTLQYVDKHIPISSTAMYNPGVHSSAHIMEVVPTKNKHCLTHVLSYDEYMSFDWYCLSKVDEVKKDPRGITYWLKI